MILSPIEIRDSMLMALSSVRTNKLRSFLTILGVMVGVASVISMASVIQGLNDAAEAEIDRQGTNIIMVTKFAPGVNRDDITEDMRNRPPITETEAEAIMASCPSVSGVAPHNYWWRPGGNEAKYKNRKFNNPNFNGTWPDYVTVKDKNLSAGRFISEIDQQYRLMVCVLGADVASTLFLDEDPIGREIRLNGDKLEVVGVFEKVKANFGNDFENKLVSIPLSTFGKLIPWEEELSLQVRAESIQQLDQAKEEIIAALRIHRKVPFGDPDNFALSTQDQLKDQVNDITQYIYLAMVVITSVGLMIGGIGVMNIMLVSVTERTREIGVRKAIGAKRSNIILQFLTEAMSLSGLGGVIGIVFGLVVGMVINSLIDFPVIFPGFWILIGFTVSVAVGMVSGVYPAIKASRLDPIESLRYE